MPLHPSSCLTAENHFTIPFHRYMVSSPNRWKLSAGYRRLYAHPNPAHIYWASRDLWGYDSAPATSSISSRVKTSIRITSYSGWLNSRLFFPLSTSGNDSVTAGFSRDSVNVSSQITTIWGVWSDWLIESCRALWEVALSTDFWVASTPLADKEW